MTNTSGSTATGPLISGIAHVNLSIPVGTLDHAKFFYGQTLGLTPRAVPVAQVDSLAWFDIADSGQQVHISYQKHDQDTTVPNSSRHPCFRLGSPEALVALQKRILAHHQEGGKAAPMHCDEVGESSGEKTAEYPTRFFARDYSGNRLEFSL
ncbi:hypothetical protein JX265_004377 [Neoarthrinium moseri]|uniref:VOC domain-containing protein n=1 Tax=Neoarthrinium moseri TaxID=1658444 RepID=A0A9P9WQW5_9PEZI|nr:uncharacterized protein JN550_001831 [Neoarthrinium moseri]KAI1850666.1 hypothetical protein JX266_003948 [Neoarthrinium moseri]KAI1875319.1 hypothetical protein JX265_004377 [Neoarthrinium moseri]KAI1875545.1 hypothetical protein JN550_001831 [Neoarthrinium moseri]